MTLRGRIYLRLQLASVDEQDIVAAVTLFAIAAASARRVARTRGDEPVSWSASTTSAWQSLPRTNDHRYKGAPKEPAPSSRRKGSAAGKEQSCRLVGVGTLRVPTPRAWKARYACLPSSIFAIALRCTSSGPSAKRSVRAPA